MFGTADASGPCHGVGQSPQVVEHVDPHSSINSGICIRSVDGAAGASVARSACGARLRRDFELVALALGDDAEGRRAFGQLVERHRPWLLRHLERLLRNQGDAQDVAQETFARAFVALRRHPPDRDFGAWLRVMATRLAYNHMRDARTRRSYHERVPLGLHDAEASDRRIDVERLLEILQPHEQRLLLLRYVAGASVDEISEELGIGRSAAKMRIARARRALLSRHDRLEASRATP